MMDATGLLQKGGGN